MKLGVISDTHGLLRPEVLSALEGCEAILHGGDINRQGIIDTLETIAPVYVVRGNNDEEWAEHIPLFLDIELSGLRIYMTHKKKDLPRDLTSYGLVVFGHSHTAAARVAILTFISNGMRTTSPSQKASQQAKRWAKPARTLTGCSSSPPPSRKPSTATEDSTTDTKLCTRSKTRRI